MLVKSFASKVITDTSYNFNKYIQYKHVLNVFEVLCFHLHTSSPCIDWMRMKSCSRFLRILVTITHVTKRKWIYKTVYFTQLQNVVIFHGKTQNPRNPPKVIHINIDPLKVFVNPRYYVIVFLGLNIAM